MSLYSYTKSNQKTEHRTINLSDANSDTKLISVLDDGNENTTIWNIVSGFYGRLKDASTSSKIANILIPTLFIGVGVFFIYQQFAPDVKQAIQQNLGFLSQGNLSPVDDVYINQEEYISKPSGLSELTLNALKENILTVDTQSLSYKGTFYISIPSLNINNMPVQANVDSTKEESYNAILKNSLAHFENTGLPNSTIQNNIVVYGHSASPSYNPKPSDPEVAFSFLDEIKVGDDIFIDMDGKRYHYVMYKSKIVEPTDISIITGTRGKRTLTLFTCSPDGSNRSRFVAIARPA
jgi:LPXTG-site transpeptidase (sortase) family protein